MCTLLAVLVCSLSLACPVFWLLQHTEAKLAASLNPRANFEPIELRLASLPLFQCVQGPSQKFVAALADPVGASTLELLSRSAPMAAAEWLMRVQSA